jgi:hypothetical protein
MFQDLGCFTKWPEVCEERACREDVPDTNLEDLRSDLELRSERWEEEILRE